MSDYLDSLTIENLKSFGGVHSIPLAPLTLIYGPNSGGKSSLLQGLLLLAQTTNESGGRLRLRGRLTDLGSYASAIHSHDTSRRLGLGVAMTSTLSGGQAATVTMNAKFRTVK